MPQAVVNGHGRSNEGEHGERPDKEWNSCNAEGNGIVHHTMVIEFQYFFCTCTNVQAVGTQVSAIEWAIASVAQKSAALIARQHGTSGWVIEAASLVILLNRLHFEGLVHPVDSWKNGDTGNLSTTTAMRTLRIVPCGNFKKPLAGGAANLAHGFLICTNHSCVAKMIVQRAFFFIHASNDVADGQRHTTQHGAEEATYGSACCDWSAIGANHF